MALEIEGIIWYLFLIDSISAVITSFFFAKWYKKNMNKGFVKHFPVTKGWTLFYLILVLWIGSALQRLFIINW